MKNRIVFWSIITAWAAIVAAASVLGSDTGTRTITGLWHFARQMLLLLPFAFVLIGLFEVWIPRETVERHLGIRSGFLSYLIAIVLASTTVGGLYVAFPLAWALHKKGAKLGVVFTFLSAAGICRIPMTLFEASLLGIRFTLVRFAVSLPLVVLSSWMMGRYLGNRGYVLRAPTPMAKDQPAQKQASTG
jgi:uncharacterized membrane protein YraQ (UPF0718 family)